MKSKENKYEIFLFEFIDRYCLYEDQGEKLFKALKEKLDDSKKVRLNFTGTWLCSSDFLNASIGKLLMYFDRNYLNEYLSFVCTDKNCRRTIAFVIMNSEKYYSDPEHRRKLDEAYAKYNTRYILSTNGENSGEKKRSTRRSKAKPV